jgi:hypothetical protein
MTLRTLPSKLFRLKPTMYSGSVVLNTLGMQWYRIFFFYMRRILRLPKSITPQYASHLAALERDGVVAIPDFFSDEDSARIRQEYQGLAPQFRRDDAEIPIPHVDRMNIHDRRVSPYVRDLFLKNPMIRAVSTAFLNRPYNPPLDARFTRIYCNQEELNRPANGGTNNLHFDAPLRVLKAFYFIGDANEENGTFYYCLGSQKRNTLKRLLFEYKLSVRYAMNRGNTEHGGEYMDNEPWVKITKEEMEQHGLKETPMVVRANTMLFANTGGFHRRGLFRSPGARESVEINFRDIESLRNTFYPLKKIFT